MAPIIAANAAHTVFDLNINYFLFLFFLVNCLPVRFASIFAARIPAFVYEKCLLPAFGMSIFLAFYQFFLLHLNESIKDVFLHTLVY